ncbi:MAG: hypothetical protein GC191_06760 [Azospirillum sp.]|nr:hypothetical protein [Azospirillum sp.]
MRNVLIALLILAGGIGFSLLLIPRQQELALMKLRDKEFDAARDAFEQRIAAGDRSGATIMPLTRLYLQTGEIDRAIALLEDFVAREPNNLEGREFLGTLYQYGQRTADYETNLEAIARQRPTAETLEKLSGLYNSNGEYDRQIAVLDQLATRHPEQGQYVIDLALLLASRDRLDEAAERLIAADRVGKGLGADGRELLVTMLLDLGRADAAIADARRWLDADPTTPTATVIGLVGQFSGTGHAEAAYQLLQPLATRGAQTPELRLLLIDLEITTGRIDQARNRLTAWAALGDVPAAARARFLGQLLSAGLADLAFAEAGRQDPANLPGWVLLTLSGQALARNDSAFLDRLLTMADSGFLASQPLLAARIELRRDHRQAASDWLDRALALPEPALEDSTAAAWLLLQLDRKPEAIALFDRLALPAALPAERLGDLAELFIRLDRIDAGFAWFDALRKTQPSIPADTAWLRLAIGAGHEAEVLAWLNRPQDPDPRQLEELFFLASDRRSAPLALALAQRLDAAAPSPENRRRLAGALIDADRAAEAVPLVRALLPGTPALRALYVAALERAGLTGELTRYWSEQLAAGGLSDQDQQTLLYGLLAHQAYRAALPFLRARAEQYGREWLFAYADAARQAGATAALAEFLATQLARPDLSAADSEPMLSLLIEADPAAAAAPLERFARRDPRHWGAVLVDLLDRLGQKPASVAYLASVVNLPDLPDTLRAGFLYRLAEQGEIAAALPALRLMVAGGPGRFDGFYRDALVKLGETTELRGFLRQRAADPRLTPEDRRGIAYALLELGEKATALAGFQTLAADAPPDSPAIKELLYLWGPRLPDPGLAWLAARADRASGQTEQAAWLGLMVAGGGARLVLSRFDAASAPPPGALALPFAEALAALGERDRLGVALAAALATPGAVPAERLRRFARLADQARLAALAATAWRRVLERRADDPEALHRQGLLAFDAGRLEDCVAALRRLLALADGDAETHFILGEALTALDRAAEAAPRFRSALALLRGSGRQDEAAVRLEAAILSRQGRFLPALRLYQEQHRRRPDDAGLKADYAGFLIGHGRVQESRELLGIR